MPDSVSPASTVYSPLAAVRLGSGVAGAGLLGAGAARGAAATGGAWAGFAGAFGLASGSGWVGARSGVLAAVATAAVPVAGAITGGSSSTVYSRSSRPFGQFASTRKSRNGSRITSLLVTLITRSPRLPLITENSSGTERRERLSPTRSKSSAAASWTRSPSASPCSALEHRNFGVQRLIELGIDVDRAETERKGVRPAQRKRDRQRQLKRSFHLDKPPNRRLKPAWGPFPRPAKLE